MSTRWAECQNTGPQFVNYTSGINFISPHPGAARHKQFHTSVQRANSSIPPVELQYTCKARIQDLGQSEGSDPQNHKVWQLHNKVEVILITWNEQQSFYEGLYTKLLEASRDCVIKEKVFKHLSRNGSDPQNVLGPDQPRQYPWIGKWKTWNSVFSRARRLKKETIPTVWASQRR